MLASNAWGIIALFAVGGSLTAWITQRLVIPAIVKRFGEEKFAETSAFDGCSLGLAGAFAGPGGAGLLIALGLPPILIFPLIVVGVSLYGIVWLSQLGKGSGGVEWKVEEGRVLRLADGAELKPLFVWQKSNYMQTDAFSGYSHYSLEVHNETGLQARNGYRSELQRDADLAALFAAVPECRALNLQLVWRAGRFRWATIPFLDFWTPLLCGPLAELPPDSREWWRQWLHPRFVGTQEILIDRDEWRQHLDELESAYPDVWVGTHRSGSILNRIRQLLDEAGRANGKILAMTWDQFQESAQAARGGRVLLTYNGENYFVELDPM
jgi:hypothetical protein